MEGGSMLIAYFYVFILIDKEALEVLSLVAMGGNHAIIKTTLNLIVIEKGPRKNGYMSIWHTFKKGRNHCRLPNL